MSDPAGTAGTVLKLSSRQDGDARILCASGQLTEAECAEFLAALNKEFETGAPRLILDLAGLQYMSSAGLGAVVSAHKRFADAGRKMILAGANARVRKLLTLTSLDRLILNADSAEEALKL
ncbi:MAG: STAS domain-containing protein [Planctomycetota bacterium]|jgi:anti-anti-sigma factor